MAAQPPHTGEEVQMDIQEVDLHPKAGIVVLSGVERDETMGIPVALTYATGACRCRAREHKRTQERLCSQALACSHDLIHL